MSEMVGNICGYSCTG